MGAAAMGRTNTLDICEAPAPHVRRQRVPARYRIACLCFFAAFFGDGQRNGLTLAIVRMQAELRWDRSTQGKLLAAFYFGYMAGQLPSGYIAARFGPRISVTVGLLCSSLLNLLLPLAAMHASWWAVAALRVLMGLAQSTFFPGFAALWSTWAPPMERSRLGGSPPAGALTGACVCSALGGLQIEAHLPWPIGGWTGVFGLWGCVGVAYAAAWWLLIADTPDDACESAARMRRTGCSSHEQKYIREALGDQLLASGARVAPPCTIYWSIIKSRPVWAIIFAHCANDAGLYLIDDGTRGAASNDACGGTCRKITCGASFAP